MRFICFSFVQDDWDHPETWILVFFFFLLIDSCFHHNFSKEYRLPFGEKGALLTPE